MQHNQKLMKNSSLCDDLDNFRNVTSCDVFAHVTKENVNKTPKATISAE